MPLPPLLRVACFGDSLTEGYSQRGFVFHPYGDFLSELLEGKVADRVQVGSFGVSGELTDTMVDRMRADVFMGGAHWDIVVVLGGTNDLGYRVATNDIVDNLSQIASHARTHGATPFVLSVPALGKMLFDETHLESQRALNNGIETLCRDRNFVFVDLFRATVCEDGQTLIDKLVDMDGLHFSLVGYKHMAQVVAAAIFEWQRAAN